MSGKGSRRRPGHGYVASYERVFRRVAYAAPMECPSCGEIELTPTNIDRMWACKHCNHEEQI